MNEGEELEMWELVKRMGVQCSGDESGVLEKLVELEARDSEMPRSINERGTQPK